jgi:hypothetical protein
MTADSNTSGSVKFFQSLDFGNFDSQLVTSGQCTFPAVRWLEIRSGDLH